LCVPAGFDPKRRFAAHSKTLADAEVGEPTTMQNRLRPAEYRYLQPLKTPFTP
jgi:hypothetical protein